MSPSSILAFGIFAESLIQLAKRLIYIIGDPWSSLYYHILLFGDFIFFILFVAMAPVLKFRVRHWILVVIFVSLILCSLLISGLVPTLVALRNTYFWTFTTLLFVMSYKYPVNEIASRLLVPSTKAFALLLFAYGVFQVQSDYVFEKPWFDLSETSLGYDGVTNFGQASKSFSLLSGPTDFASFGLFVTAIGFSTGAWLLSFLGLSILVLSGTRGILFSIPIWLALSFVFRINICRGFLFLIVFVSTSIFIFGDFLITYLYSLENSRFSLATLAPRIQIWSDLNFRDFLTGGGLAANLSSENPFSRPTVIDSGLIYFTSEIGVFLTFGLIYFLLKAIQIDLIGSRRGALQFYLGILLVSSIAQLPLYSRLSNFLVCLLIYTAIYYHSRHSYSQ